MHGINPSVCWTVAGVATVVFLVAWLLRTVIAERALGVGAVEPPVYVKAPRRVLGLDIALWLLGLTALIAAILGMVRILVP